MTMLNWCHHTLIQALLSRGPLPEKEVHSIFYGVTGKKADRHDNLFRDFLLKINKELAYAQFELRACSNQYNGEIYYGVMNNVADEQSKLGTKFSVPQIAFYKSILEAITHDAGGQGCISNIDALNIRIDNQVNHSSQDSQTSSVPSALKNFSLSQKEKTLGDLVHDGWLCSTSDGYVGLGVRSFLDLRSWFRNNGVPLCEVCNEAAIKAEQCNKEGCPVQIHQYCLKKKFSGRKVARVCPGCSSPWCLPDSYEEEEEQPNDTQGDVPSFSPSKRKRERICKEEAVQTVQNENEAPDNAPARNRRLRSCKAEKTDAAEADINTSQDTASQRVLRKSTRSGLRCR